MAQPCPLPVALFFSQFIPGGTERQMIELARRLDRRRFQVHLACFHRSGPWLARAEHDVAGVAEFPIRSFRYPSTLRQMRAFSRWCREHSIAVVHTTDLYANIFGLPAAAAAGVPVRIANRREINPDKSFGLIALQRASYACAHRVVANSNAAAERLVREGVSRSSISVIGNGLDLATFVPPPPRDRLRRVITVANLRKEKAHEVLIDAAVTVLGRYPDAEFWIVGGGARYDELTALARARGVHERVTFFGHREDVPSLLAQSDVYVLPSLSEAFPSGVIEAMAAGLPVVATGVGGIVELVDDRRNGLLVPPGDSRALARAICEYFASPALAADLARAGRRIVERRFSFDRMVAAFEELYLGEFQARRPFAAATTEPLPS